MQALADILGLKPSHTCLVNMICEAYTYCTSIVARDPNGSIVHVRNLDFGLPETMKKLIVEIVFVKGGAERGRGYQIAGFLGSYTSHKPYFAFIGRGYSISYNVRESTPEASVDTINDNFRRNLDAECTPA